MFDQYGVTLSKDEFELHMGIPFSFCYTEVTNGIRSTYAPQSVILYCCSAYLYLKGSSMFRINLCMSSDFGGLNSSIVTSTGRSCFTPGLCS